MYTDNSTFGGTGNPESDFQVPFVAGTMTNLWCRVKTAATATSTVVLRRNSANANNTFSITANTTGAFQNSTPHTDTVLYM